MRKYFPGKMLLAVACMISGLCASGQAYSPLVESRVEIAVNFEAAHANTVPGYAFWMQGGSIQAAGQLTGRWALVGDVSSLHAGHMPHMTTGLDLFTAALGPRFTMTSPGHRVKIYGQGMGGIALGRDSVFPNPDGSTSSANGAALLVGGGIDERISQRFSVRLLDAEWLRTALSNGTTTVQNNLRLESGIVFHFGAHRDKD